MSMLDDALLLAQLGLAVHWLRQQDKIPVYPNWHTAPAWPAKELRQTFRTGFNVGIHTGAVQGARSPVVVLDLDSADALDWARFKLPLTPLRVLTRRGEHWYFAHPGVDVRVASRVHIEGRALDVRGDGAQVVCPPSVHPSGAVYRWVTPPTANLLAALPTWSPAWFAFPSLLPIATVKHIVGAPVAEHTRRRAEGFARNWNVAESGAGRGTQTYKLAVTLVHGLQLDAEVALSLLKDHFNPRLPQPYDERRLRRKVEQALQARHAAQPLVQRARTR